MDRRDLDQLAWDLASRGLTGQEHALRQVLRAARARDLPPVLIDILADRHQPEVARLRAFGRLAALLERHTDDTRVRRAA